MWLLMLLFLHVLLHRPQIFGEPPFSNCTTSGILSFPTLSSQNEQTVGTSMSLTDASTVPLTPPPQAGTSLHSHLL